MQGIDAYTLNKIAGWVLGTFLLVFGLNEVAHIVYHAERPEEPAIAVAIPEEQPAAGEEAPAEAVPIANLLANANPEAGQGAARACQACHTFEQGGANKVGPNLWNTVGAPIAGHEGFAYSDALQAMSDQTWTYENLSEFLANPRAFAPGTKMTYGGMRRDEQRADLIAYLRTLSDNPQPLPEPAAEAPADTQAPAGGEAPAAGGAEQAQPAPAEQPAGGGEPTQPAQQQQPAAGAQPTQPGAQQQPQGAQQTQPSPVPQPATGAPQPAQ